MQSIWAAGAGFADAVLIGAILGFAHKFYWGTTEDKGPRRAGRCNLFSSYP